MILAAAVIYVTATMPLPIRPCSTDSDCWHAAAAIGCREFHSIRRPNVQFVCDRAKYRKALRKR